ncbi:polysaccharide biosynthesis/export family protein [Hymenobacter qilianensis]|uniref:Polysaccharide biosynthesis/export family protein n=3 Tax=Hymenobacter qilianensis TaxID=1385715 RepID=A0A7H0H0K8_9BACT|nr:polysaccharide biosynthesis/export family protein [Hymenobacter qilianensis]QNP54074.1 polysaccharide biosynthesis/export family protein [Hymenobacter qilianensis]
MLHPIFRRFLSVGLLSLSFLLSFSCTTSKIYRQNVLFRLEGTTVDTARLRTTINRTERNYIIQSNDYLDVRVYTNKGERILDPNGELPFGNPGGLRGATTRPGAGTRTTTGQQSSGGTTSGGSEFLVQDDGIVKLPMVENIKLSGYTLLEADSVLQVAYSQYYEQPFVVTRVTNNRIIVLGAVGGTGGQVIPMTNDNMNLIEVLAIAGGIDGGAIGTGGNRVGRTTNIRLIRGDLKNPQIQVIDLSTFEGMRRANLQVEPNDIVYVEPVRRPFYEALTDAGPVFGLVTSLISVLSTLYIITRVYNN